MTQAPTSPIPATPDREDLVERVADLINSLPSWERTGQELAEALIPIISADAFERAARECDEIVASMSFWMVGSSIGRLFRLSTKIEAVQEAAAAIRALQP